MMETIFDNIPVKANSEKFLKAFYINNSEDESKLTDMIKEAENIVNPKGVYKESFIQEISAEELLIDNISFKSSLLVNNLRDQETVFAFVITVGHEIGKWAKNIEGLLEQYWAMKIQEDFLQQAVTYIFDKIEEEKQLGKMATMNPGSINEWPISEQLKLFNLIGEVKVKIGVELTDNYLMLPSKSLSGFRFINKFNYVNCKLCTRVNCPDRRANYDENFYKDRYN